MIRKFLILFSLVFFLISTINAVDIIAEVSENVTVTDIGSNEYSILANGVISFTNPSLEHTVYEFRLPIELDSFVNIGPSVSTNDFDYTSSSVKGYIIDPNQTISTNYTIYGVINFNAYNNLTLNNISMLEHYSNFSFEFVPQPYVKLDKPEREDNATLNSTRVVTAEIINPTDFEFLVRNLSIYKTTTSDPFFNNGSIVKQVSNLFMVPYTNRFVDYIDTQSQASSVYWLSSDIILDYSLTSSSSGVFVPFSPSSSGGGGGGNSGGSESVGAEFIEDVDGEIPKQNSLIIRKNSNSTSLKNSDEFEVTVVIVNNNDFSLTELELVEEIPSEFKVIETSEEGEISNDQIMFTIPGIKAYGRYEVSYTLTNNVNITGVKYLKPSTLNYKDELFFSEGVALLYGIDEKKKVFIQKEVNELDDKFDRVTIRLRNLGTVSVEDLLVTDLIEEDALIRQISQVFHENKRGVWNIKELKPGEEWEVSYLIEKESDTSTLPNVFGIEKSEVFGILISSKEVVLQFNEESVQIEKIGLGVALGIVLFYLLF